MLDPSLDVSLIFNLAKVILNDYQLFLWQRITVFQKLGSYQTTKSHHYIKYSESLQKDTQ